MVTSEAQTAARMFGKVMRDLARKYGVSIPACSQYGYRTDGMKQSYKQLLKVVHPDKGGDAKDFHDLFAAETKWKAALAQSKPGRPSATAQPQPSRPRASAAPGVHKRPAGPCDQPRQKRPAPVQSSCTSLLPVSEAVYEYCAQPDVPAGYRIRGEGVLLTWNGSALQDPEVWDEFSDWLDSHFHDWGLVYLCNTYETCRDWKKHPFWTRRNLS